MSKKHEPGRLIRHDCLRKWHQAKPLAGSEFSQKESGFLSGADAVTAMHK